MHSSAPPRPGDHSDASREIPAELWGKLQAVARLYATTTRRCAGRPIGVIGGMRFIRCPL